MALNGKSISVKHIIEGVYRDFKFNHDINFDDCVEWIGEGLLLIGELPQYVHKFTDGNQSLGHESAIEIVNGRGVLPCDLYQIIMVRNYHTKEPLIRTFDKFHNSYRCESEPCTEGPCSQPTYKVNNNYIFTSYDKGKIEMSYMAIATDNEGFPLIPDNQQYIEAMKYHLAEKLGFQLYIQDKLSRDKLQAIEQKRDWYFGAAQMQSSIPDIDQMESIKNQMVRLIPKINQHKAAFKFSNNQEQRYTHNSY
jgi:hypothetical protein